jgi:hypothetical protein
MKPLQPQSKPRAKALPKTPLIDPEQPMVINERPPLRKATVGGTGQRSLALLAVRPGRVKRRKQLEEFLEKEARRSGRLDSKKRQSKKVREKVVPKTPPVHSEPLEEIPIERVRAELKMTPGQQCSLEPLTPAEQAKQDREAAEIVRELLRLGAPDAPRRAGSTRRKKSK